MKYEKERKYKLKEIGREKNTHRQLGSLASKPQNTSRFARSLTLFTADAEAVCRLRVLSTAFRETAFDRREFL